MEKNEEKTNDLTNYYGGLEEIMDIITERLHALTDAMRNTIDYQSYLKLEAELDKDQELKKKVDEFRIRNFALQEAENIDLFEAVDRVEKEYRDLRKNPVVAEYLAAELSVCRMIQKVFATINNEIKIDVHEM